MNQDHYKAAKEADETFHRECIRQFGKLAGDCRYQPDQHDERTAQARRDYQDAIDRLFPKH